METHAVRDSSDEQAVALVTGSTSGLGREVARRLGAGGVHVLVHGRDRDRGRAVAEEIEGTTAGSARFYRADLSSMDRVRELAEAVRTGYGRLDLLISNAGIWLPDADERPLSPDGHELHFAVNYLAGFLLTRLLLPMIRRSAPSRVVQVASGAQRAIDFDDLMLERGFDGSRAYAQSKLVQVMFTFDLARELEDEGVTAVALHPATYMDTRMVREAGVTPRSTVEEGADAVMRLATAARVESGRYFEGERPARAHPQAYDEEARHRLRVRSRELVGLE